MLRWRLYSMAFSVNTLETVMFGRNEGGGQCFHGWLDRLLKTDDQGLPRLFNGGH